MNLPKIPKQARAAACWALAGLFFAAAWGKLRDPLAFADSVAAYRLVPWPPGVNLLALTLPVMELFLALMLLTRRWRRTGLLGTGGLTFLFTAALVSAMARGLVIDCGCFGEGSILNPPPAWAVARNAGILLLCAVLYKDSLCGQSGENR